MRDLPASIAWYQKVFQATLAEGTLPHYGREWRGYAELLIEPCDLDKIQVGFVAIDV